MKYVVVILFLIFYTYIMVSNDIYKTSYEEGEYEGYFIVKNIDIGDKVTIESNEVIIYYYEDINDINIGDKIYVSGTIKKPSENTIFNLFNYKKYLKSRNIYYILEANEISVKEKNTNVFYKFKNYLIDKIESNPNESYLKAFILGDKSKINDNVLTSFNENGISHLLAISGMHVSLLTILLSKILKKDLFCNIFLIFYAFLAGFTPSVIRAATTFIFRKRLKQIDILIILISIFIIYNPFIIYDIGFLFSFTISIYLCFFGNVKNKNYFIKLFKISLLCNVVSLPILINNYFYINLTSVFMNMIFVPIVSLFIFPLVLITLFLPINITFILGSMENLSLFLNQFNLIYSMKSLNMFFIFLYYLIITISIYKYKLLIVILIFIHINYKQFDSSNYLTMIDVGQGDCFLFEINNKTVLIDTGGNMFSDYNMAENKIIPYLRSRGINKIDYLILSHGDYDHLGEALNLINGFKVNNVLLNSNEINRLEQEIIDSDVNYKLIDKTTIMIDKYKFSFINNSYEDENDSSLVFYTNIDSYSLLFTGDISSDIELKLIDEYDLTNIDILKVAHHGSLTSTDINFVNKLNPKYSLISVGKNNYGHPNIDVLNNLKNSKVYSTLENGSVLINLKTKEIVTCFN